MKGRSTLVFALVSSAAAAFAQPAIAAGSDNPQAAAYISEYRCAGGRALAVSYPAPRYRAVEPVKLAWDEQTVTLTRIAPRNGLRFVSTEADIVWTTRGRNATLTRRSDGNVLVSGCVEQ